MIQQLYHRQTIDVTYSLYYERVGISDEIYGVCLFILYFSWDSGLIRPQLVTLSVVLSLQNFWTVSSFYSALFRPQLFVAFQMFFLLILFFFFEEKFQLLDGCLATTLSSMLRSSIIVEITKFLQILDIPTVSIVEYVFPRAPKLAIQYAS